MHNLPGCVHAGVGASGAYGFDRVVGNRGNRFFDQRLDANAARLFLPAVIRCAVVFNAEGNSHYRVRERKAKRPSVN
jgi:hypothetical protein